MSAPSPAVAEHTPRMRRVMVDALRPSHVPIAWHSANGMSVADIAHRLRLSKLTVESALRDIRAHLGVSRTVEIREFAAEIRARFEAAADARSAEQDGPPLLTSTDVARLFRVDPKTVTRWAAAGRLSSIRTPGGHRRFREDEVRAMLGDLPAEDGDQ